MRRSPFIYVWIYAVIVFLGHSFPVISFGRLARKNEIFAIIFSDEAQHFLLFGFLAWLLCYGYHKSERLKIPYIQIFVLSLSYGALIEVWQIFLPYRVFELQDIMFDGLGILVFMVVFILMKKKL